MLLRSVGPLAVVVPRGRLSGCCRGPHPHPNLLPSREKGPDIRARGQGCEVPVFTGTTDTPLRPSALCALRCRARWIPAFAGMTGAAQSTMGAPLRPVCAPLSRTLDSSLRWNDGACAGTAGSPLRPVCAPLSRTLDSSLRWNDGSCAEYDGGAPPPRVRSAVTHAGFQPSLE